MLYARVVRLVVLLALTVGLSTAVAQLAANPERSSIGRCTSRQLAPAPGSTVSGAWMSNGTELLLVDMKNDKLLRYPGVGTRNGVALATEAAKLENFFPSRVATRDDGGLLLELSSGRLVALDRTYTPARRKNVFAEGIHKGVQLTSIFSWNVARDEVISLSDLKGPGPTEWRSALVRFPFDDPSSFSILQPLPSDASRNIFRLGYDFMATIGTDAYILLFDDGARIYRNAKRSTHLVRLSAFPEGFEFTPTLPRWTRKDDFPVVMAAMTKTTMAAGLYAWRGDLWVLTRKPEGNATRWELTRIDPNRDEVLGKMVIPTKAEHLTVVPGPLGWAFVEKTIRAIEDQDIKTYLYVPASRISQIGQSRRTDVCQ